MLTWRKQATNLPSGTDHNCLKCRMLTTFDTGQSGECLSNTGPVKADRILQRPCNTESETDYTLQASARALNTGTCIILQAIKSEVHTGFFLSCNWLQQSCSLHKTVTVLFFPHTSPAAALQPSNALWRGFELAHRENPTKSVSIYCCVVCGCGCCICLCCFSDCTEVLL